MTNAIFDEHKGVYRVTHGDGTFDTYTPTQFAELGGEVVIEEEEEIVVPDEKTPPSLSDEEVLESLSSPELKEMVLGSYKLLQPIPYTDEDGNQLGETEVGSIQEVPVELGDSWVEQGLAIKVAEEEKTGIVAAIKNIITR